MKKRVRKMKRMIGWLLGIWMIGTMAMPALGAGSSQEPVAGVHETKSAANAVLRADQEPDSGTGPAGTADPEEDGETAAPNDTEESGAAAVPNETAGGRAAVVPNETEGGGETVAPGETEGREEAAVPSGTEESREAAAPSNTEDRGETSDQKETASAAETGEYPHGPEPETAEQIPVTLRIDSEHIYEGMDRAYQDGYIPTVSGETVILVLPLTADGRLENDRLTATLGLGDSSSTPFEYKNYEKNFYLERKEIDGSTDTREIWYVVFELALSPDRYQGVYPVTVHISARDRAGNDISQNFPIYVTIADGKDPGENGAKAETPSSSPIVLVSGYTVMPETVQAGEDFTVEVVISNTSTVKSVQNMVVTVNCQNEELILENETNTIYLPKLGKGESTTLTLSYRTEPDVQEGRYAIALSMTYEDPDAMTLSSAGTVYVWIRQPLKVEWTVPSVAKNVNAGDTVPLSFQVMNLGRSRIYNVRCDVSGYGLIPTGTAFIGDMEAGTESSASLNLLIGTKDLTEGYTGTERYGSTVGTITLTYEDGEGTEYTQKATFETTIGKLVITSDSNDDSEQERAGQWRYSVLILAAAIAVIVAGMIGRKIREKRKRASFAEERQDELPEKQEEAD